MSMKNENKPDNYPSLSVGDEVLVECAKPYHAEVTDINGSEIGIKVLEEPAKGSRTTAPLSALKKIKLSPSNDYCPHGYDSACLICGFGTKNGKRVWHTRPALQLTDNNMIDEFYEFSHPNYVIESTPSPMPDPLLEIANRLLNEACNGLGTPSRLCTGGNYTPPFKTKDEWKRALAKAQKFDPNSFPEANWPTDWPRDANFYRINGDTPIFYKHESGQITRWVKYAKCWVNSYITDWPAFCRQNAVQVLRKALRGWPAYSIAMLQECAHRNNLDYMTLMHGEWPAAGASDAVISPCKQYRYQLRRHSDRNNRKGPALFLMLNPSTADATFDDPTIKRCRSFAESFGYSGLTVVNLYALRSTNPAELWKHPYPVGPANNTHLAQIAAQHKDIICAWGGNAKAERVAEVVKIFKQAGCTLFCLGTNLDGSPKHPLYIKADTTLMKWNFDEK